MTRDIFSVLLALLKAEGATREARELQAKYGAAGRK
jgi:hypothetical protein